MGWVGRGPSGFAVYTFPSSVLGIILDCTLLLLIAAVVADSIPLPSPWPPTLPSLRALFRLHFVLLCARVPVDMRRHTTVHGFIIFFYGVTLICMQLMVLWAGWLAG